MQQDFLKPEMQKMCVSVSSSPLEYQRTSTPCSVTAVSCQQRSECSRQTPDTPLKPQTAVCATMEKLRRSSEVILLKKSRSLPDSNKMKLHDLDRDVQDVGPPKQIGYIIFQCKCPNKETK